MIDISKIHAVLRRASHWDLYGAPFGGNYVHGHLFRPVADPEELGLWEELAGVALPEDYRRYLTCCGNGGAGPYYGILPFRFPLDDAYRKPAVYALGQEQRFHELAKRRYAYEFEDADRLYEAYCSRTPDAERMDYSQFEEQLWERREREVYGPLYEHGLLAVGDLGCSGCISLLLNGSHRGFVGGTSPEGYFNGLAPDFPLARELERWEPFADYMMGYVRKAQELCDGLPAARRRQALRERELVLSMQEAVDRQDWKEALRLLQKTDPKALSEKTSFFFKYHRRALCQGLPEEPAVTGFYQALKACSRWNYERYHGFYEPEAGRVMKDGRDSHCAYAVPTFRQFFQTYVDMTEDIVPTIAPERKP